MEFSESAAFAPTSAGCLEPSHGPLANEIAFGQRVEKLENSRQNDEHAKKGRKRDAGGGEH
jgi:hypothetical protein